LCSHIALFPIFAAMKELLIRSVSGLLLAAILLACVLISPWTYAALLLFIVTVGTFEMSRLLQMNSTTGIIIGETFSVGSFALATMVALEIVAHRWLLMEIVFLMVPFLYALFSVKHDAKHVFTYLFGSFTFLCLPSSLMLFMYREDLFGNLAGPGLIILVFCLLWANDIFAYLTGKLLGKHKLFPRISPGKTIEGSLGGLVFAIIAMVVFAHYAEWLPKADGIGMAAIAVVFGTLGDLSESMLKRQAGVKDSGKLIPGHGGILDRFDSVMFSVPFIFVYLLLL
jgi:phosphatidate cytidylyltransferase